MQAINYVARHNQTTESRYPYTSGMDTLTGTCNDALVATTPSGQAVKLNGTARLVLPMYNEAALMAAVAIAPTTIYLDAKNSLQIYAGGVYNGGNCSYSITHVMVIVGYVWTGASASSYWIVRNSWGSYWGEAGYARIQMTGDQMGICGMYQYSLHPPSTFVEVLTGAPVVSPPPVRLPPRPPSPRPPLPPTASPSPSGPARRSRGERPRRQSRRCRRRREERRRGTGGKGRRKGGGERREVGFRGGSFTTSRRRRRPILTSENGQNGPKISTPIRPHGSHRQIR